MTHLTKERLEAALQKIEKLCACYEKGIQIPLPEYLSVCRETLQTLLDAKTAPTPEIDLEQLEMALKENSWVRTVEENNIIQNAAFKYLSEKTPPEKSE